jgi:hypothetical protein
MASVMYREAAKGARLADAPVRVYASIAECEAAEGVGRCGGIDMVKEWPGEWKQYRVNTGHKYILFTNGRFSGGEVVGGDAIWIDGEKDADVAQSLSRAMSSAGDKLLSGKAAEVLGNAAVSASKAKAGSKSSSAAVKLASDRLGEMSGAPGAKGLPPKGPVRRKAALPEVLEGNDEAAEEAPARSRAATGFNASGPAGQSSRGRSSIGFNASGPAGPTARPKTGKGGRRTRRSSRSKRSSTRRSR